MTLEKLAAPAREGLRVEKGKARMLSAGSQSQPMQPEQINGGVVEDDGSVTFQPIFEAAESGRWPALPFEYG